MGTVSSANRQRRNLRVHLLHPGAVRFRLVHVCRSNEGNPLLHPPGDQRSSTERPELLRLVHGRREWQRVVTGTPQTPPARRGRA
eukprot:4757145-Prymnesium_polylepis.1